MNKIDYQALREAAVKAGEDKWQAKKINGDFFVIRHGSYTRQHGYTSYQPIAEIDCKPVRDFVAKANPATVLALLDERERNQQYIKRRDQENEEIALTVGKLRVELEAAEKRLAELQSKSMRPVAWMRSDDITTFGPIFTKNENYAVEQWGDNAVALYASPVNFKLACFTDERNLKYINERGRETSLIWSERNSENGDVQLFRAAGIRIKGE
ncbi:ead/Ea22-like family protein [Salmonella enterica subsp. enterica serovar Muenchen]|uniref:ead/Ea22-like family protein n=1 Tax=Salmonella enterica TaxID=28901 RepID=UPI000FAD0AB6|nr:ead/Ea22-like family protein [Salmonella enterica]EDU5728166.1 ead/Ea22-like family protein [Salmonella enterica subsp. enterica serovar Typhimurium var. 5-]EAA9907316.1 ead/Ea22-like family protein [Salmonella enterica]EAB1776758.1 ead/Ea22-like family protein [Salmonella enterica]EAB2649895.1 ead/Ea22-like family protein [Salmonella enterica]EAP3436760.1 ead/Ea22-like family protein [Salmonella enterica]